MGVTVIFFVLLEEAPQPMMGKSYSHLERTFNPMVINMDQKYSKTCDNTEWLLSLFIVAMHSFHCVIGHSFSM